MMALATRTFLDFERWLISTHQINEFFTPTRFVDHSFTQNAVRVLGSLHP